MQRHLLPHVHVFVLQALAALRARYGFMLAVDEAHATLVCGDKGGGAAEALGVADQVSCKGFQGRPSNTAMQ